MTALSAMPPTSFRCCGSEATRRRSPTCKPEISDPFQRVRGFNYLLAAPARDDDEGGFRSFMETLQLMRVHPFPLDRFLIGEEVFQRMQEPDEDSELRPAKKGAGQAAVASSAMSTAALSGPLVRSGRLIRKPWSPASHAPLVAQQTGLQG